MRNYVSELQELVGNNINVLSKESKLSKKGIRDLMSGKTTLKSGTKDYENIRNAIRRNAYFKQKTLGVSAKEASRNRRVFSRKEAEPTRQSNRIRKVKSDVKSIQYSGTFEWQHITTKEIRIQDGFSRAFPSKDEAIDYLGLNDEYELIDDLLEQAKYDSLGKIIQASHTKSGDWELKAILRQGFISYEKGI